jgi:sugar phosphate isomerase/epimerase
MKKMSQTANQKPRVSVQTYTIRDHVKTPADTDKAMQRLHQIGYKYIQISAIGPMEPAQLKDILDKNSIVPISYHLGMGDLRNAFEQTVNALKTWGVNYCAVSALGAEDRKDKERYIASAREMNQFGKRLFEEHGIHLQYHNHAFEFQKFDGKLALEIVYEESDPKYLQAEIDTHWVARGGCDPVEWILKVKGRMDQIHIKDLTIINNEPVMAEIGEGNLNWNAIFKACKKTKVIDYIIEQDLWPVTNDPFKSLEISLRNMQKMGFE